VKLYRICTENMNRDEVEKLVSSYVEGFTILEATGYWQGQRESSLVIEIAGDSYLHRVARDIAKAIKTMNAQQAVLIQILDGELEVI
jgi:hypothetical protein